MTNNLLLFVGHANSSRIKREAMQKMSASMQTKNIFIFLYYTIGLKFEHGLIQQLSLNVNIIT
jgi:hypothetical protein